jgi:hypothetical protein
MTRQCALIYDMTDQLFSPFLSHRNRRLPFLSLVLFQLDARVGGECDMM